MNSVLDEKLRNLDINKYIDQIQEEVGNILREVGRGETEEEREKGRDNLQAKIKVLSKSLTDELGLDGDYIIVFLLGLSLVSSAWVAFILKAKSLDERRSINDRIMLKALLDGLPEYFGKMIMRAIDYGKVYDNGIVRK